MKKATALSAFALPINARVLHRPGQEVRNDVREARLAPEAIEERQLSLDLNGFVRVARSAAGLTGGWGLCLLYPFLPGTLTGPVELLRLGHRLTSPLIGLAAAGGKEVLFFLCCFADAAADRRDENREQDE